MNNHLGAQRPGRVDRNHNRVTVIHQLNYGSWRINPHHSDEGSQYHRIKARLELGKNRRKGFVGSQDLHTSHRVTHAVVVIDQGQNLARAPHIFAHETQGESATVCHFMVLGYCGQNSI